MAERVRRVKTGEPTNDEVVAALRELLELQDQQLREKDKRIAALERAATIRERRRDVG